MTLRNPPRIGCGYVLGRHGQGEQLAWVDPECRRATWEFWHCAQRPCSQRRATTCGPPPTCGLPMRRTSAADRQGGLRSLRPRGLPNRSHDATRRRGRREGHATWTTPGRPVRIQPAKTVGGARERGRRRCSFEADATGRPVCVVGPRIVRSLARGPFGSAPRRRMRAASSAGSFTSSRASSRVGAERARSER